MKSKFNIIKQQIVKSTNDFAKELLLNRKIVDFSVITANEQLAGKGQRNNTWFSDTGKNLTLSIITYPVFLRATEQFYLSKVISLGIVEYLNSKNINFKIKWPNDIYFNDKKICGILIENSIAGLSIKNSIIGIGLNINQEKFPEYLPDAISLSNIKKKDFCLETELLLLLNSIYKKYQLLRNKLFFDIDNLYHKHLYKINEFSDFKDNAGIFKGKISGTLPEGKLIIETLTKEKKFYNFKEVGFLPVSEL
ncbi:MAG: biotin--[acetyl-CoA-carboxylase] ligase [Bacteroidales bacterium]|nr:biotin--[acetyl-CoA-carboxylase] ligase [Bacteroidales bacterium]